MKISIKKINEEVTINCAMEDYKRHMVVNNFSPCSIDLVRRCYKDFCECLNNDNFLIKDLNNWVIEDYIFWLKSKENKDTTKNIKLSNLRMFFYWCINNNYCYEFKINLVKEVKTIRPTYSETQLEILLKNQI